MRVHPLLPILLAACAAPATLEVPDEAAVKVEEGKADSSAIAVFVDFELDGEVIAPSGTSSSAAIEAQLLYTVGQLNARSSVARLDDARVTDVQTSAVSGGTRVTYHASLPVAWGQRTDIPSVFELVLPRTVGARALQTFTDRYKTPCTLPGHTVAVNNFWYHFRPAIETCQLADDDVVRTFADVSVSTVNTNGRYPEYHRIWEDDVLKVVAVFGRETRGATANTDPGISAYNTLARTLRDDLYTYYPLTTPETIPDEPGVAIPEIEISAVFPDGRAIEVTLILVDEVRTAGAAFDRRYAELTPDADLIVYNGHAGLGTNVDAFAQKGAWRAGQYAIVFLNGCDTYTYFDRTLIDRHRAVNPDDPNGTRYLDVVNNAMPAYFSQFSRATMALIDGLLSYDLPRTYQQMFAQMDRRQVVLVSGEQDNEYVPSYRGGSSRGTTSWSGMTGSGTLASGAQRRYATPVLAPGRYVFSIEGTGDADLYVQTGTEPSLSTYECRPYLNGSNESCVIELSNAAAIHALVHGATSSTFTFRAARQ